MGHDGHEEVGDAHGRHEERYTTVLGGPAGLPPGWPDVAAVVLAGRGREAKGRRAAPAHYYATSLRGAADGLGGLVRRPGPVENGPHWEPDVAFRAGANGTAAGHAGANLGLVRRVAAALRGQDPGEGSIKAKRLQAGWDDGYRLRVLQGCVED